MNEIRLMYICNYFSITPNKLTYAKYVYFVSKNKYCLMSITIIYEFLFWKIITIYQYVLVLNFLNFCVISWHLNIKVELEKNYLENYSHLVFLRIACLILVCAFKSKKCFVG